MKKAFTTGLLAALAAAVTASAQETRSPRVAVLDLNRVSAESLMGKSFNAQFEKLQNDIGAAATQKSTELGKMDAALKALQDELEKQGAVLSPEARDKKQQDITRKGRERQAFIEDSQAELAKMRERAQQQAQVIQGEFRQKLQPIMEQVAKENAVDLVVTGEAVLVAGAEFDLTAKVIAKADELEKAKPAAAAPAASGPAAPKPPAPKPPAPKS